MSKWRSLHHASVALVLACLCVSSAVYGVEAAADPDKLAEVLGSGASGWTPAPTSAALSTDRNGAPCLVAPAGGTLGLESKTRYGPPMEYKLVCRLNPAAGAWASAVMQVGRTAVPNEPVQHQAFSIRAVGGQGEYWANQVLCRTSVKQSRSEDADSTLHIKAVGDRSLAWPEEMRKTIETQMANAPKLEEMRFVLRCTVEGNRFRTWLNGRFIKEMSLDPDVDPAGALRIELSSDVQLLSVRTRALNPVELDRRFEPLLIDSFLNASEIGRGKKVDRASLPVADQPTVIDGVPFVFPALSDRGDDHIDVGTSWVRFGALPGAFGANYGMFGGRWVAADRFDPARIAMRVPQGRYKALHVIAVADEGKDSVPVITAQFYRPGSGHPLNFAGTVPGLKGDAGKARVVPVKLANGKKARLYHAIIPLDPDAFSWFTDLDNIGLEITKQVQFYRGYPDPTEYSWHAAGLPSSVRIYAMALERPGVDVDVQPDRFGHVWTAPASPGYTLQLNSGTGKAVVAKLLIETRSEDGKDTTRQEQQIELPADGTPVKAPITLKPTRYGMHELTLAVTAGGETATYRRNFAYLHEETREQEAWESGRGPIFGFWEWGGGHETPTTMQVLPVMAAAGAETSTGNYSLSPPELKALAEKHRIISESAFCSTIAYITGFTGPGIPGAPVFDPADPEASAQTMIEAMREYQSEVSAISRPTYIPFFTEPNLWPITTGTWPTHWGEEGYTLNQGEQERYEDMSAKYLAGATAIRKEWPDYKLLMPYGEPMNTAVFLRLNPKLRGLIDGCALDMPGFERLPEQQINQVTFNRMYATMKDMKEYLPDPYLVMIEGFCVSSKDIDTGEKGQADIVTRNYLLLIGYGVTRFESAPQGFDCANYWGEQHYGGGLCTRLPVAMPKPAYVHFATLTRHLNRANFTKYVPTGSTSTYCEQFKHYKTGELVHVLWTIRGTQPVTVKVDPGATLALYDANDNRTELKEKDGTVTFDIGQSPCYLEGLTADAVVALGASDHSDAEPAKVLAKLGNLGDGSWAGVEKEDKDYTKNKPYQIERFPGKMSLRAVEAPKPQGSKALAVHLEKQEKDRGVMPFYTTLEPKKPIKIPGKGSHLGLWVHAASDWGRVVYSLRDAKGEKWISVGTKEDWNNDDIQCWSAFCFDGWRYLRFELPSSAPYDSYREYGTTCWGSFEGDGVIDLPLRLERIIVERRPKVIYGNDLVEAKADDVLLGDLYVEYASPVDKTAEVVRLSKLRMPIPEGAPELSNPIAGMTQTGTGAPTRVLRVTDPAHWYDGTRCHVHFEPVADAKGYDVWVSPYADGRGAMQLGSGWTGSGELIQGLRPDTEFYVFVVHTDKDGQASKPSAPLKIALKAGFGYK